MCGRIQLTVTDRGTLLHSAATLAHCLAASLLPNLERPLVTRSAMRADSCWATSEGVFSVQLIIHICTSAPLQPRSSQSSHCPTPLPLPSRACVSCQFLKPPQLHSRNPQPPVRAGTSEQEASRESRWPRHHPGRWERVARRGPACSNCF